MPWKELHITTSAAHAAELSDQLSEWGALAVTFQDAGNQPIYEPSPDHPLLWQETIVTGLFEHTASLEPIINTLENQTTIKNIHPQDVPDEDWERRCLDQFKPVCFGSRLWICPSWHALPDPQAPHVILDPGLAFGTGSHPTTALCLTWLAENLQSGQTVIDYGCGSGILAIAALKLGAKNAIAVDHDPQALLATQENAERNAIDSKQLITLPANKKPLPAPDILIANILAQPLITLAPYFSSLTKTGSQIILSGILQDQITDIISAYTPWFVIKTPVFNEEWVRLEGIRK